MAKGKKTGGRKPGSINKTTASVKQALRDSFDGLGGVDALVRWGKKNRTEFYKLWGRMLPQEIEMGGKDGQPMIVKIIGGASMDEI